MRKNSDPDTNTIAAIATPMGEGGLGVIRLSGPNAIDLIETIFSARKPNLREAKSHTLHHGWVHDGKTKIDEVVVGLFRAPHSYTGEDVVEVSCHGSPPVLKRILRLLQSKGAQLAEPGEFTKRAYLNEKMDLSQAEAVAELISAKSEKTRAMATAQLTGALSTQIKRVRDILIPLLAQMEANLDFVEEDIPALSKENMNGRLKEAIRVLDQLLSTRLTGRAFRDGLRVTFVGKPNVGKSSLFNSLLAMDRAIVTNTPGTTRDVLEEPLQWNGLPMVLTDTAGLGPTDNAIEKMGTQRALQTQKISDLLLFVVDSSQPFTAEDDQILQHIMKKPHLVVLNKKDFVRTATCSILKEAVGW